MIELSESMFDDEVLEVSKQQVVLVDFWAPWCGPCRMLGPILEKLSQDYEGRVRMVKVNADNAPQLSKRYQIRSIPMVMLFKDGQTVDQFMGVRQESEIRRFIDGHLPRVEDKDLAQARRLSSEGKLVEASQSYKTVIALNPGQESARLELIQILLQLSLWDDAAQCFEVLRSKKLNDPKIAAIEVLIDAAQSLAATSSKSNQTTESLIDSSANPQQCLQAAQLAMLSGRWTQAMDLFLDLLARDRRFAGDLVRQSMLAIFQLCPDSQVVSQYRRKLGPLLN
ncbi:MAG: thioredoxin [Betaproteobacteria bacterium]|nr:thioredoxin [Betaproteobacteria bacterium]